MSSLCSQVLVHMVRPSFLFWILKDIIFMPTCNCYQGISIFVFYSLPLIYCLLENKLLDLLKRMQRNIYVVTITLM